MNTLLSTGLLIGIAGLIVVSLALISSQIASRRREELIGSEDPVIPLNLASVNDAVIVARVGGQVSFVNEAARQWFGLDSTEPDLWLLSQKAAPAEAFLELFATEGQSSFAVGDRQIEAASHRITMGEIPQFIVVMREEVPLPVLDRSERGSSRALQVLSEVTTQITGSLDLDTTLRATLSGVERLVPFDAAQITLMDTRKENLIPAARTGPEAYTGGVNVEAQGYRLDEGYTGWIARRRQALLVNDISSFDDVDRLPRDTDPDFISFIGVPLTVSNRFIGTLEVMGAAPGQFDREDLAVLNLLAGQAAISIENARQYHNQAARVTELSGLQRIAAAISDLRDPRQLYAQLGQHIAELMNTEMAGVLLLDKESDRLVAQRPLHGVMDVFASRYEINMKRGTPARVLWEDVDYWFSNDVAADRIVEEIGLGELAELTGVKQTAMAAMTVGEERIGVLQVSNKTDGGPFTLEDIRLLQVYANQAAIIVESTRLYSEEQSRVAELQGLQQITQAMSAFNNPEQLFGQLTQRVAELMDVEICGILIYEQDEETLNARRPFYGLTDEITKAYSMPVARRGLAREVWRDYELFSSNHVFTDERIDEMGLRDSARDAGLQTMLLAPLSVSGRRFGMLQVSNKNDGADFDEDDKRLVTIFAGQAAALIDNARLYQDTDATLRKRAAELRSVSRISRELNATLELERILEVIAVEAQRADGAEYGTLVMFDWDENSNEITPRMRFGAEVGEEARILETATARSQDTLIIEDFERVPHYPSPIADVRSALTSPIFFENKVVGSISLYGRRPGALGASAAEFVQALCSQATIAVTNATRHAEQVERSDLIRRRAEQFTQIFELGRAFRSDQSMDDNLISVTQAIRETVGFDNVLVAVRDPETGSLTPGASIGFNASTIGAMYNAPAPWDTVVSYLTKDRQVSFSYLVRHDESDKLLKALHIPRSGNMTESETGWQPGDLLLVPLYGANNEILGLLVADRPRSGQVPDRDIIELLEIFGNQATVVIENSLLYRDVEERAEELSQSLGNLEKSYGELDKLSQEMIRKDVELSRANDLLNIRAQRLLALHRIMESVDSTHDPDNVLRQIAVSVIQEMDVDACVLLKTRHGGSLEHVASAGKGIDTAAILAVLEEDAENPVQTAMTSQQPQMHRISGVKTLPANRIAKALNAETYSAMPMAFDRETEGVMLIGSATPGAEFTEDDRDLFMLLASQTEVEYENARLYRAVQSEASTAAAERDRLQQLHLVTTAFQQTDQIYDRLRVIARGIRSVGWGRAAVTLHDTDMNTIDMVTAGIADEEVESVREQFPSGETWLNRLIDPTFNTLMVGSSFFIPFDHELNSITHGDVPDDAPPHDPAQWHPDDQLYLPMYAGTAIIGIISLSDPADGLRPNDESLRPLELFAQQAASTLENARLYQETLELQSFTEAVLESIQQGIIVTDSTGRVESINSFLRKEYDWPEDIVGKNLFEARPELAELGLDHDLRIVWQKGQQVERTGIEYSVRDEIRTVNVYAYPRADEPDEPGSGAVLLLEDTTTRARLEADIALRAAQLEALNESARDITASLSVENVVNTAIVHAEDIMTYNRIGIWRTNFNLGVLELLGAQGYVGDTNMTGITIPFKENPLLAAITKTRESTLLGDAREDTRIPLLDGTQPLSWIGAPMLSGGNIVGIIVFERMEAHGYTPADLPVISAYANQVAVALENARLFEESEERTEELSSRTQRLALLNRISATLGQSLDQASILQTVSDELIEALDAPSGLVMLFDHDANLVRLTAMSPSTPTGDVPEFTFPLNGNPAIETIRDERRPVLCESIATDERLGTLREALEEQGLKTTLLIPLVVGSVVMGMFAVSDTRDREFNAEQIELAQTVTNQAAVSVQNARLFMETVARQRELSVLSEAGRIASASLDLDTVVQNAARYFIGALDATGCTISLWNKANNELTTLVDLENDKVTPTRSSERITGFDRYRTMHSAVEGRGNVVVSIDNPQLTDIERERYKKRGISHVVLIPLIARDESIGLVELWEPFERRFTQRQLKLAGSLATTVATAMENARLHDETQRRVNELARINQISRALTQTITSEDLYRTLVTQIGEVIDAHSITIARRNDRTGQMVFPLVVRNDARLHLNAMPFGDTLYSYVMEQNEPLMIDRAAPARLEELGVTHSEAGLKSFLAVPLVSGEVAIGVLAVEDYKHEDAFQESDLRVLGPIAAQVAVSIENARLYGELEQRLSETQTLQEVSRVVNSALDLQEIFERVVSELASAFAYPVVALYSVDGDEMVMQAQYGFTKKLEKKFRTVSLNTGVIGRAARLNEAQFVDNTAADPDYLVTFDWITAEIVVPIVADEKVLGVLAIQSGEDNPLEPGALPLLSTFADQVATAMSNARLYREMVVLSEELEQRVEERTAQLAAERDRIDTLYRIAVELTASLDLDRVLNRALELVGEAVGAEHGSLYLVDPSSDKLIHRAVMAGSVILPPGGRQIPLSRHEGMAGWVMDNRESIVVENVQYDPRWSNVPGTEHNRGLLGAPLIANHEVLGCLFFTSNEVSAFSQEHVRLVEAAAQQVANSINNAELYRMIRDQAERLGIMLRSQQTEAAKSQAILESVADGVMVSDQAGEIILFNAAAERILGLRRDEVLGRPSGDLTGLYGANAQNWGEEIKEISRDPDAIAGLTYTEQIEVSGRVVSVSASPVMNGMEYLGVVYVFRDITAEVLADRVKTQFVANVSHELRTPLTVIKGYADLLLMGRVGEMNEEQRGYVERVRRHADRLTALVNDLLNISRIEQGEMDLKFEPVDLHALVEEQVHSMRLRMDNETREVEYINEIPADFTRLQVDRDKMAQVLANLLANGYQYTEDGGSVTVRAVEEDNGIRIDVADTGIGIPGEDQEQIFDRFFRGEHPLVMRAAGTGLGLSIVQTLVAMHNGRIWFESEENKGTTFSMWIPFEQPESGADLLAVLSPASD